MCAESGQPNFTSEPLSAKHDREAFSCGVDSLDIYLQRQAGQDLKKHAAVSFVMTPDGKRIAGYYTLSQYAVQLANVPEQVAKKLPRYPLVPATLIGRLAVSSAFRAQGLGGKLLMDALYRIWQHAQELASAGVVVDASERSAIAFYVKYGFLDLPNVPRRLFLPMETSDQLFR